MGQAWLKEPMQGQLRAWLVPVSTVLILALCSPASASASPTQPLTVSVLGTGTGAVTSSPAGIDCGSTCSAAFAEGATVTLTGAPGANTQPVQWSGCDSIDGKGKCLVAMSAAREVEATFDLVQHQLTVTEAGDGTGTVTSSPAGIDCGETCQADFDHGATVTLTGTPGPIAHAVQWTGCNSVDGENKCIVAMNVARSVTATFIAQRQLTVSKLGSGTGTVTSSPAGIECGEDCSAGYDKGSTVTLTGTPGTHTEAVKWSGCDTVDVKNECLVAMSAARTVTAAFYLEPQYVEYTVSVQKKGTGQGTVTSVPGGIDCGADCSQTYVNKTRLALIATPAPGSVFDHWSGGNCSGTGPCEATIVSSRLVKAHFLAIGTRTLTVAKAGTGQGTVTSNTGAIDCGQTCSAEIDASSKIALTATAAAGSKFAGWSGACAGTAATCKVAMNEARDVSATFAADPAPPAPNCVVPRLAGKTLARARRALAAAHCSLGKVSRPKASKLAKLRVRSSSPAAGRSLAAGAKVNLRLAAARGR